MDHNRSPAPRAAGRASKAFILAGECPEHTPNRLQFQSDNVARRFGEGRRITAQAETHLRDLEWRIGRLGQLADKGHADRSMVVERIGVACELARLDEEAPR
jgi:hypothetical protein